MTDKNPKGKTRHKAAGILRRCLNFAGVAVLSSIATATVCNYLHSQAIEDLNEQIKSLREKEQQAKVIQRTSVQMEDIAYQQKEVSDRQRERAEHESRIADMERDKAEMETRLAETAKRHAILSARHADSMSVIATRQSDIAVRNMQIAEHAKAQSDTLFYKSLSTSLAQSSLAQESNDGDLSRLLAYASWHYATRYSSDVEDGNVYKALLRIDESAGIRNGVIKGGIRGINTVTVDGKAYVIAISDYGELVYIDDTNDPVIFHPSVQCYRDMAMADGTKYAAITSDGKVSLIDYEAEIARHEVSPVEATLPEGLWTHIVSTPDGSILTAMSANMLVWLSASDLHVIATAKTSRKVTAMGYAGNTLHIFGDAYTHYVSDTPGATNDGASMTGAASPEARTWVTASSRLVTAYRYDGDNGYHILGFDNGDIEYHRTDGTLLRTLSGHSGAITHLDIDRDLLVSSSYDSDMRFWFVKDLTSLVTSAVQTMKYWPYTFTLDHRHKVIWIGMGAGNYIDFSYSMNSNASMTHSMLKREFTKEEWDYYIGPAIPYQTFMKPR